MRVLRPALKLVPVIAAAVALAGGGMAASGSEASGRAASPSRAQVLPARAEPAEIPAVGAENEYADVISQIGGRYTRVTAVMSNPNTDPHEFEASASVAEAVSVALLVVQNGAGYDSFMDKIEQAGGPAGRAVIVAARLLRAPSDEPNPHFWYDPRTMPLVAGAVGTALSRLQPGHAAYFKANVQRFDYSLRPWVRALAQFSSAHRRTPVAVTEPVADYMLAAAGARVMTPQALQSAIMNGTDPSPEDISIETNLLTGHRVKALLYNRQVTDSLTAGFLAAARKAGIPVVGVYETMPAPGFDYQRWMMAELSALERAVVKRASTVGL